MAIYVTPALRPMGDVNMRLVSSAWLERLRLRMRDTTEGTLIKAFRAVLEKTRDKDGATLRVCHADLSTLQKRLAGKMKGYRQAVIEDFKDVNMDVLDKLVGMYVARYCSCALNLLDAQPLLSSCRYPHLKTPCRLLTCLMPERSKSLWPSERMTFIYQ